MGYPSFFPETALALLHALVYGMACILAGAALIALTVYIVLVCSEMFSRPRSKSQRAKVPVAKEGLDLSAAETPILAVPERLGEEAVPVTAPLQSPMTVPTILESEPTWT